MNYYEKENAELEEMEKSMSMSWKEVVLVSALVIAAISGLVYLLWPGIVATLPCYGL